MKLNCKPGDLAVIVRNSPVADGVLGMIVEVLSAAPNEIFKLPCGFFNSASTPGDPSWVCKFQNPITVKLESGEFRRAVYASVRDAGLRPLRPGEGDDETLTWAGKPEGVAA